MGELMKTSIRISTHRLSDNIHLPAQIEHSERGHFARSNSSNGCFFGIDVSYNGEKSIIRIEGDHTVGKTSTNLNMLTGEAGSPNISVKASIDENGNVVKRFDCHSKSSSSTSDVMSAIETGSKNESAFELDNINSFLALHQTPIRTSFSVDNLLYENGQLYHKLAEWNKEHSMGESERSIIKAPYKPKKPKRSMKYDKDHGKFIPGTSVESIPEVDTDLMKKLNQLIDPSSHSIPEEELDAFIQCEKTKFSGDIPIDLSSHNRVDYGGLGDRLNNDTTSYCVTNDSKTSFHPIKNSSIPSQQILVCGKDACNIANVNETIIGVQFPQSNVPLCTQLTTQMNNSSSLLSIVPSEYSVFTDKCVSSTLYTDNFSVNSRRVSVTSRASSQNISLHSCSLPRSKPISRSNHLLNEKVLQKYIEPALRTYLPPPPPPPPDGQSKLSKKIGRIRRSIKNARNRIKSSPMNSSSPVIPRRTSSLKHTKSKSIVMNNTLNEASCDKLKEAEPACRTSKMLALECERQEKSLQVERALIEKERHRLMELKRQAAEKAEVEWIEKKKEEEKREQEEKEIEIKKEELARLKREQELAAEVERKMLQEETEKMKKHEDLLKQRETELAELHKERARREELEQLLETKKIQQNLLDQTLNQEKEKLTTLERNFAEERSRRLEIEKRLQVEECRNRNFESEKLEKKPNDSRSVGNGVSSNGTLKRKTPSYNLSLRSGQSSGNAEETNLLHHILALGHVVDHCPEIKINRYSCRGYLQKMGKSRLKISWKRRWFVFDRKLRALCYYQDERKTKSKGILYFQSIQEVYVDSTVKRSPNPKTTFCIRTPTRPYVLSAPSAIAMSIWIDVICTGKEGVFISIGL